MAKVVIENATKRFGKVTALYKVSLEIKDKEFVVILGPSGSGKTTLLRSIAGLEYLDDGNIWIDDRLVNDLPPKERDVAMVFQNYALYPHMRVYDNIAFPLKLRKLSNTEIRKKVHEVAKLLNIEHLLARKPSQLSGGEQQRVALARALVRRPKVFLMDEPLSNLDAKLRIYMRAELKRLQKEVGITTIYVTHDQVEAMTMADRIAVMNNGRIQQVGTPLDLFLKPSNTFVASFIGSPPMNLIDCSYSGMKIDCNEFSISLKNKSGGVNIPKEVYIGFRPEHLEVRKESVEEAIPGEIFVTEPLGSETIVNVKVGKSIIKAKVMEADVPQWMKAVGNKVYVKYRRGYVYIFDKKSGRLVAMV